MSTKPVTVPRWGDVSGALVTPTSGKLDIGWVPGERPPAQYLNWYQKWVGDWCKYLNDGDLSLSGLTFPVTAKTIANAVVNNWDPGTGSLTGIVFLDISGGGASAVLTGLVGGVEGRTVILQNSTGSSFTVNANDAGSTAANRFNLNNGASTMTVPNNGVFALRYDSGVALWRLFWTSFAWDSNSLVIDMIPASAAMVYNGSTAEVLANGGASWDSTGVTGASLVYPIKLPVGAVLNTWKLYANKQSTVADSITASLYMSTSATPTVAAALLGTSPKSNATGAPGNITLKDTGIASTVAIGHAYFLLVTLTNGAGAGKDYSGDLEISYRRPFMLEPTIYTP